MKIAELKEKQRVEGHYLVTKKEVAVSKAGKPYLIVRLMDSTGEAESRGWDRADDLAERFDRDDVVNVRGTAVEYQGAIQINISSIDRLPEDAYSLRDFLPSSERSPEEMVAEFDSIVDSMEDPHIKELLKNLFAEGGEVRELYMTAPAAMSMHHAFLGGLLEHVLSVCSLAGFMASHYENINRDLLMAGVILHDIGKIYELSYKRSFNYTDEGKLLGHIVIGSEMIGKAAGEIKNFPEEKLVLLKHMILSHHGILEYGSPKRPKFTEAIILSFIDDLDAKVQASQKWVGNDTSESNWTARSWMFERPLFKGFPGGKENVPAPTKKEEEKQETAPTKKDKDDLDLF
ncbi:MAG: HD domain-containing protein [Thermodesulfobacteriota bacterium]